VDCDTFQNRNNRGTDMGCNGGLMDNAFSWASKNGGLCEWEDYPYISGTTQAKGKCDEDKCKKSEHTPKGYTDVKVNDANALMSAIYQQPVAIAIEADQPSFQLYKSGVYSGKCGANLDHGVLVVGYGTDKDTDEPFWKVKNSWGEEWGEGKITFFAFLSSLFIICLLVCFLYRFAPLPLRSSNSCLLHFVVWCCLLMFCT
jgi:C1A family cysteine protease